MRKPHRHLARLTIIAAGLLAIGASNTECDGEAVKPLLMSLREIHAAIDDIEEAVCDHYELSGHGDVAPDFCPDLDPCDDPMDVGPCDAAIPRWYFDAEAGECLRFIWGGCEANGNNFLTKAACEATCDPCEAECADNQVCVRDGDCSGEVCDYCADTCRGAECPKGEHCELVEVRCITTPCPPVAMCVEDDGPPDPCDGLVCEDGYHCEAMRGVIVECLPGTPCRAPATCIPDIDPCDDLHCASTSAGTHWVCTHGWNPCQINDPACDAYGEPECAPADPCMGVECPDGDVCRPSFFIGAQFEDDHQIAVGHCSGFHPSPGSPADAGVIIISP